MSEVDLWADEAVESFSARESTLEADVSHVSPTVLDSATASITHHDGNLELLSKVDLRRNKSIAYDLEGLYGFRAECRGDLFFYSCAFTVNNCFSLRHIVRKIKSVAIAEETRSLLTKYANRAGHAEATIKPGSKTILVTGPKVKAYFEIIKRAGGRSVEDGYSVPAARALDLEALSLSSISTVPKIVIDPSVLDLTRRPLAGYDGNLESLKKIPTGELNIVAINSKPYGSKAKGTTEENLASVKIATTYDLLFTLPKKFIDKSNPQEFERLVEGEEVTLIGAISKMEDLPNNMGLKIELENARGNTVKCNFWRQVWLKRKFKMGDEVLITGKASWFRKKIEIGGASIEHAEEAAIIPIVPVYKQWPSKGVTTQLLMSANRELISRSKAILLPPYFEGTNQDFKQAITELHFPTSIEAFKKSCDDMAYQELVYMQLLMAEAKHSLSAKKGLAQNGKERNLQNKLTKSLPFSLTKGQVEAVKAVNEMMSAPSPGQVLLLADVGAGKSICSLLGALKTIDSGHQAVVLAPTEVLSQQLYSTFSTFLTALEKEGEKVNICLLSGGLKAAEKKVLYRAIEEGEIDIIVGTSSVLSDKIKYHDLGFIAVDEQQKFGAEQRSKLLSSRHDDIIPDLLMQTATPIPRSTAQAFYGDVNVVEINEKPAGRLPIITEWIQENPQDFIQQMVSSIWDDIRSEAKKGNQIFVITPMVQDSEKVDAASVEKTYKELKATVFKDLSVGFIHGQMAKADQQTQMEKFRSKEFDILVASTVVEVGVDIPDATRVIVLSADRLGASTLHQIRGRVGRNSKQSKCYLVSEGLTENSQVRLQSLVDSQNGFEIAMADLNVRGEGKVFGTDQTGATEMIFASLLKHRSWIDKAREDAEKILNSDYRDIALRDAREKFNNPERLY